MTAILMSFVWAGAVLCAGGLGSVLIYLAIEAFSRKREEA